MPPRGGQLFRLHNQRTYNSFKSCPREGGNRPFRLFCDFLNRFKSCPREGGNWESYGLRPAPQEFQVMPPRGGQLLQLSKEVSPLLVSSHAPARGATIFRIPQMPILWKFQVMPPRGGQRLLSALPTSALLFQVMPPRGGQPLVVLLLQWFPGFQVMPPRGGQRNFWKFVHNNSRWCFKSCPREGGNS